MYSNNLGTSLIIREEGLVLLLTQRLFFLKKYCNQMKLEKKMLLSLQIRYSCVHSQRVGGAGYMILQIHDSR